VSFLSWFGKNKPVHLVAIKEGSPLEFKTFAPSEHAEAKVWIEKHNLGGANIYFHVNPLNNRVRNRKAKKEDVTASIAIFVDIDDPSDDALQRALNFPLQPSITVFSGNGWHLYWFLSPECTDLDRAENVGQMVAKLVGGDHCWNRDRLLRVPGTVNWPNAKKLAAGRTPSSCYVDMDQTAPAFVYSIGDFDQHLKKNNISLPILPDEPTIWEVEEANIPETDRILAVIETGDDPERPRGSASPKYPSRSEAVFAVACDLLRRDVNPDMVLGILINPRYGISESVLDKPRPVQYARRQVEQGAAKILEGWPDTSKAGKPLKSLPNAKMACIRLSVHFENDRFHNRKRIGGHQLQSYTGDLSDDAAAMLRNIILDEFGFDPGKQHLLDAIQILCIENSFHPIVEYLHGLEWDAVPRLETWLIDYLGAEDTAYIRAVGKLMLVAAVRRVRHPGVKFDTMVVLEGKQGTGKSTAVTILAGSENFSDQNLFALDDKSQMEAFEGVWLFEVAELDGMSRAEVAKVKALISRTEDRGRPAYARFKETWPRQCILIGTTNEDFYLKDTTGNRRFLPVKTTKIDLKALQRDRDQLWAEACELDDAGYSIVLPKEHWAEAAQQQSERMQEDPWADILGRAQGEVKDGKERISTETLFTQYLEILPSQRQSFHPKRVATVMRQLGWNGPKKVRIGGNVVRGYERATETPDTVGLPGF